MAFVSIKRKFRRIWLNLTTSNISWGAGVVVDWGTKLINNGNRLVIGKSVYLRSIAKGYQAGMPFATTILLDVPGAEVRIGEQSRINGAYIHAQKSIIIGAKCVIASGVNILDTNGHELLSTDRTQKRDTPEAVVIGDNVWIGLNAIILKGSTIGENSVVSAGSVVKGDFPASSLIVGNPARAVKALEVPRSKQN